jgi:hypothetical protein
MKVDTTAIAFVISTILAGAAPLTAYAQTPDTSAKVVAAPGKVKATATTKETFAVLSVNAGSREVLLMSPNGKLHTVNVSDQVRNFDQIRVGDQVTVEYTEAISLELKKHGPGPGVTAQEAAVRTPLGARPGAAVGRTVTVLANVVAVDTAKQIVTLRGPQGNEFDVSVQDPSQLNGIKKGDEVEAAYTEELAVSVQSTPRSHTTQ